MTDLDLLVIGSGVGGLTAAVRAADLRSMRVGVLTKGELAQSTTRWAQGGVAAVLRSDEDSTDLHLADTLAAGGDLCDVDAVRVLVDEGPDRVNELIALGAVFDRDIHGRLEVAKEGGHSSARIVHAGGAATGAEIERALVEAVREGATSLCEGWFATELIVENGRCRGVRAVDDNGNVNELRADHVLLATGGAGQLFAVTTNPREATGDGVAIALRAGVAVADVEFVQFHPTALHHPAMPRPLLSEALRGHGAILRDRDGDRFIDELLPRDKVSRAMAAKMAEQEVDSLWLDATGLEHFAERFPTIASSLAEVGLDPAKDWLPIAPAAHYLCGGVVTDLRGATSMPHLWACGEVACTGVHGANRLASNSLLEAMVFGARAVEAVASGNEGPAASGAMRALLAAEDAEVGGSRVRFGGPQPSTPSGDDPEKCRAALQLAMTRGAGVLRDATSLAAAGNAVSGIAASVPENARPGNARAWQELDNLAWVASAVLASASAREESRGAHARSDYPDTSPAFRHRLVLT